MKARYRPARINLSPWCRSVAGDTTGLRLPAGYWITGLAKTGAGPWTLELWHMGELKASHEIHVDSDVRPRLLSLVDIAAIDEHERTYRNATVTTDADGWVRSITDA